MRLIGMTCLLLVSNLLGAQFAWNTLFHQEVSGQAQLHTILDTSHLLTISTGASTSYFSNSISLDDVSVVENNIRTIDFDLASDKIEANNILSTDFTLNLIHLDYGKGQNRIRAGYGMRSFIQFDINENLFELLTDGNEQFIGQTVEVGPKMHLGNYHQFYLGYNFKSGGLNLAFQGKFLTGLSHLESTEEFISLTTSDDIYQISLNTDYALRSSKILKYEDLRNIDIQFSNIEFSKPFKGNYGYGLDVGLSFSFDDNRLFFNAYDLGRISWTNLTRKYVSQGTFEFEGLDIVDFSDSDNDISVIDSLESLLEVEETLENYSSNLPGHFVLGFDYQLMPDTYIGLLASSSSISGSYRTMYGFSARKKLSQNLTIGVSYSILESIHAIGFHGSMRIGRIKLVFATDQATGLAKLTSSRLTNARLALSYSL